MKTLTKKLKRSAREFLANLGLKVVKLKYFPKVTEAKVIGAFEHPESISVIFDVGANVGQSALEFAKNYPRAAVHSFEPFEENFAELVRNASGIGRIKPNHLALSNKEGVQELFRDSNPFSEWNSLEPAAQASLAASGAVRKEEIQLETGDGYCEKHGIQSIDILKVDTEGHDLAVLEGFSKMLNRGVIRFLFVECGFMGDASHTNFLVLSDHLRSLGYDLAGFYETCILESGKCEFTNAFFVKSANA